MSAEGEKPKTAKGAKKEAPKGGVTTAAKTTSAVGLAAAFGAAILLNVIVARQYKRWDMTSSKLYSISEPTRTTLQSLKEPVEVNVLLAKSDGLLVSLRHLLMTYTSETTLVDVRYIDPDKDPLAYQAFLQKHGLASGRTEDGRVVTEAAVVVVKGDKRWFLTQQDLVDLSEADEGKSRPKLEQGLTTAIRNVLSGEKTKVCFSKGHGELGTDEPGARGLGELKHRLDKNNVEVTVVDSTSPDVAREPWRGCNLVYIAGPQSPWTAAEAEGLSKHLDAGGSLIAFLLPMLDRDQKRVIPNGLESVLAKGGVEARQDVIIETAPGVRLPSGAGETFFATPKPHPVTQALVDQKDQAGSRLLFTLAQSLGRASASTVSPADLVSTSADAFSMADFLASRGDGPPEKRPGDRTGPLTVATASELPKLKDGSRGARMIVVGSPALTQGSMWEDPRLRGGATFVESAISWLTSRPQIVDIPAKPSATVGLRLTEESLNRVRNYVVMYIPAAMALLGYSVYLRRRSTEKRKDAMERTKEG
jgi:hypothetical protein